MSEKVLIALIAAAGGIIGAFKLPEIIKDLREMFATKNKALLKRVSAQRETIIKQRESLQKYEQLKYKIPLIVDFVKIRNQNDPDTLKLMDMLQKDYTGITSETNKPIQQIDVIQEGIKDTEEPENLNPEDYGH